MDEQDSFDQENFLKSFDASKMKSKENLDNSFLSMQSYLDYNGTVSSRYQILAEEDKHSFGVCEMLHSFMRSLVASHSDAFSALEEYKKICREMVNILISDNKMFFPVASKKAKVNQMLNLMTLELNTWTLIQALCHERLYYDQQLVVTMGYNIDVKDSEKELMVDVFKESSTLRQAQIVIDWLEYQSRSALQEEHSVTDFFSEYGACRENTLHALLHKERNCHSQESFVNELDPDAPIRQNKKLSSLDEDDEDRLMHFIFSSIKSGQLEEACEVCNRMGQSWRTTTLQGWKLFHDPNVKCLGPGGAVQKTEGNQFRDLWRLACWQMAENDNISVIERAVYASLSCHLKHMLPACKSWHEYLWAYTRVFVDQKVENHLRLSLSSTKVVHPLQVEFDAKLLSFEEIFCEIESSSDEEIKIQSQHRFNIIQKYIILNQVEILVECMSRWCTEETLKPHPILLRFMTHLTLFFKFCGASLQAEQETAIVACYVEWLIKERQVELIATYVAYLSDELQVMTYAKSLIDVTGTEGRKRCMDLAQDAGLDTKMIALHVVSSICNQVPFLDRNIFHSLLSQDVTEDDLKKIDSIEWLLLDNAWILEAIQQSNALFRMFISYKKLQACDLLKKKLPKNSIEMVVKLHCSEPVSKHLPSDVRNSVREFVCIIAYLEAQGSFSLWFNHLHHGAPIKPFTNRTLNRNLAEKVTYENLMKAYEEQVERWNESLSDFANQAILKIKEVIEFADGGWMVDQESIEEYPGDSRSREMILLRQMCIPFLFTLLHTILHAMERYEDCLKLYDPLMSEHQQLYKVFTEEELERISDELTSSSVCSLNQQLDSMGYPLY